MRLRIINSQKVVLFNIVTLFLFDFNFSLISDLSSYKFGDPIPLLLVLAGRTTPPNDEKAFDSNYDFSF